MGKLSRTDLGFASATSSHRGQGLAAGLPPCHHVPAGSHMNTLSTLLGLFALAFAAATIIPAQSEAALAALVAAGSMSPVLLVAVASLGNVLGSAVNWALGRFVERFRGRRWFPVSPAALDRAAAQYARWGHWSLLLSWVPFIGDPLTLAAGLLREPLWRFVAVVGLAKTARYGVVAAVALGLWG